MMTPSIRFKIALEITHQDRTKEIVGESVVYGAYETSLLLNQFGVKLSNQSIYKAKERRAYLSTSLPYWLRDYKGEGVEQHVLFRRIENFKDSI
ncbi:MAG: hypothetical protein AAFO07_32280 [Bacteroidota bacterium]